MVYLVGAGPGDRGLITEKGKKCIEIADVIVFDKLANASLMRFAREDCEFIYAGKQAGNHHLKQNEINDVLVQKALEGKTAVRLKGGDPFVFGRGGEEAAELVKLGIPFEIVPGVSSCYSVGAYAGIPVTHRDYASSFHVITGHEKDGKDEPSLDFKTLAQLDGTLVFLMSLKNLPNIAQRLIDNGKNPEMPCAVIQRGTTSKQKCVSGTLKTICEEVKRGHIKTPALTIVGEVVRCREQLAWFGGGELFGVTVMLTGTREFNGRIGKQLEERGAEVLDISLIGTRYINADVLDRVDFSRFSHLVLTSRNGVGALFESLKRAKRDVRTLADIKIAAVGSSTADALAEYGIQADIVPDVSTGKRLGELIVEQSGEKDRVLLVRSERAVHDIDDVLRENGIAFEEIAAYETYTRYSAQPIISAYSDSADYAVIASPSAADAYKDICKNGDIKIIAIGGTTARYMREIGFEGFMTADTPDADGIADVIIENIKKRDIK